MENKLYFWAYLDENKWRFEPVAMTEKQAEFAYRYCGGNYKKVFEIGEWLWMF